jgi:transcriptional regulator with XRE-family HTH domain
MTVNLERGAVLAFDTADRLRKSLRVTGITVQQMADYLEVSRNTVSLWINGRGRIGSQSLRLWAIRTGIPYEWFRTGTLPDDKPGSSVGLSTRRTLPPRYLHVVA